MLVFDGELWNEQKKHKALSGLLGIPSDGKMKYLQIGIDDLFAFLKFIQKQEIRCQPFTAGLISYNKL